MEKHAILILSHSDISHIYKYASIYPNYNFYIHQDIKFPIVQPTSKLIDNIHILPKKDSFSIMWAGFSMIEASNSLFLYALENKENSYFHLISGSDLILQDIDNTAFESDKIYMQYSYSKNHRYRTRFNAPHANTHYLRTIPGKSLTFALKVLDKLVPTNKSSLFGSQWFSINRHHLEIIMNSVDNDVNNFFRKKLCPDEHYYQYLIHKNKLQKYISNEGNRRYIVFDKSFNNGNNPIPLNASILDSIDKSKYWFARKADQSLIKSYIESELYK